MSIIFISLNKTFNDLIEKYNYKPDPIIKTYYVSPSNCFMDGGIDDIYNKFLFPNI
jgi:hypothetical protein